MMAIWEPPHLAKVKGKRSAGRTVNLPSARNPSIMVSLGESRPGTGELAWCGRRKTDWRVLS